MSLERFGQLRSLTYAISICLAFGIGWMADKFHPIRIGLSSPVSAIMTQNHAADQH